MLYIYLVISAACAASYGLAGMTPFDAINHAMTTVSTGGFSTHDQSIAFFQSSSIEYVAMVFMLIAAVPFMLYLSTYLGRPKDLLRDGQVRSMFAIYFFVIVLVMTWLMATAQLDTTGAFRQAAFNVISIGTTTGYVSADYMRWGGFAVVIFFFLTFVGGCSGSTSGGIKIFRFNIASVMFRETIQRLLHPSSVYARSIHGRPLSDEILASVMAFCLAFAVVVGLVTLMLAAAGNHFVTSFSAAATATANVGPGIGNVIGPTSNFAALTAASKWILCSAMLLGRLEIFTALILLTPAFWRD